MIKRKPVQTIIYPDATGGIRVLLDATNLYGTYPVGRRVHQMQRPFVSH